MRIAIVSIFRDSPKWYIKDYFRRAKSIVGHGLEWFLVEGDSINQTYEMLKSEAEGDSRFKVFKTRTGLPYMHQAIHKARFTCLAKTYNVAVDVAAFGEFDYLWYLDSDLLYQPDLLSRLAGLDLDVVAPICMARDVFYDVWGYRHLDGETVGVCTDWIKSKNPIRLLTAGACVLFKHRFIERGARLTNDECIVGLCKEAAKRGAKVWLDPTSVIWHPIAGVDNDVDVHMAKWGSSLPQF